MDRRATLVATAGTLVFLLGLRLLTDVHALLGGLITAIVVSSILGGVVAGFIAGGLSAVSYREGYDGAIAAAGGTLAFPVVYGLLTGSWPFGPLDPVIEYVALQWRILIPGLPLIVAPGYVVGHTVARFRHLD